MRVARYYGPDDVRVEEAPRPEIGPGELLVRVGACGICGSDTMDWYLRQKMRDGRPLVLGHEPAGEVVAAGAGAPFAPGTRVFVHHHVPCGACRFCRRGHETLCQTFHATNIDPGGFAEYIRVPAPNASRDVLALPPALSFAAATVIEPLACCVRALGRVALHPGDVAAVVGSGAMGLLFVQLLRLRGAGRIVVSEPVPFRREMARRLGADEAVAPAEAGEVLGPGGADAVIVCAGSGAATEQGLTLAGPGATVLLFAPPPPGVMVAIEPYRLFFGEQTVVSSYSAGPADTREALRLLATGQVQAEALITHQFELARAGEALRLAREAGASLKVLVLPSE
jgi:L-iditol 2-dehydrogenase